MDGSELIWVSKGALIPLFHSPVMFLVVTFGLLGWISRANGLECWETQINVAHSAPKSNATLKQSTSERKLITCKEGEICYSQFTQFQNESWISKEFKQGCKKVEEENLHICQCKNGSLHSDKVHDRVCTCADSQCSDVALNYRNKHFDCSSELIIPDPQKTDVCPPKTVQCFKSSKMNIKGEAGPRKEEIAMPYEMVTCPSNHVCAATFNYHSSPYFNQSFAKRECMPSPKTGSICSCSNGTKHDPAKNIKERTCLCTTTECSKPAEWYFKHFNRSDEVAGLTEPTDSTVCVAEPPTTSSPKPATSTSEPTSSSLEQYSTTESGISIPDRSSVGSQTISTTKRTTETPITGPVERTTIDLHNTTEPTTSEATTVEQTTTISESTPSEFTTSESLYTSTDASTSPPKPPSELDCSTTVMDEVHQAVCEQSYGQGWVGAVHQMNTVMCLKLYTESERDLSYAQVKQFCAKQNASVVPLTNEKEHQLTMCQVNQELEKDTYKQEDYYFYLGANRGVDGDFFWEYDSKPVENTNIYGGLFKDGVYNGCLALKISYNNRNGTWVRLSCSGEGEHVGAVCAKPLIPK